MSSVSTEDVLAEMRAIAAKLMLPRFRALKHDEVHRKGLGGDIVTRVDIECEEALNEVLPRLLPGSKVVGEEQVGALTGTGRPPLDAGWVWIVDPLDGTRNFANGIATFAMMVGLLHRGEPVAGWILDPINNQACVGERGAGARLYEGMTPLRALNLSAPPNPADLRLGFAGVHRAPEPFRSDVLTLTAAAHLDVDSWACAGREYMALVQGQRGFSIYGRAKPWDHAPGMVLLAEAGGLQTGFDGTPFTLGWGRLGLVNAANAELLGEVMPVVAELVRRWPPRPLLKTRD